MTRDDWLACGDPAVMLNFLRDTATDRKLRLFACACGRDVWRHLSDERSREAILTAERFADGDATFADLLAAHRAAADAVREIPLVSNHRRAGISRRQADHNWGAKDVAEVARRAADPTWDARTAARAVAWNRGASRYALLSHLRDIFNPFRSAPFDPAWLTSTVTALARCAYDSREFSALPILADALQDAGCEDDEVLGHCRGESVHVRGCWVIDALLEND